MTEEINAGSLAGFNEFCKWLIQRGGMKAGAVEPLRSAANQIVNTVDGDAARDVDLRILDVDEYLGRFENKAGHNYSPNSLRAYRSRFGRGVDLYRQYLEQGATNFRPPAGRAPRKRKPDAPADVARVAPSTGGITAGGEPTTHTQTALVDFPFPLRSGQLAHLYLPQRLDKDDAERMAAFVRALVLEPQRQITSAGEAP